MTYPDSSGAGEYQQQPQTDTKSAGPNPLSGTRNGSHNEFIQKVNLNLHTYMRKYFGVELNYCNLCITNTVHYDVKCRGLCYM